MGDFTRTELIEAFDYLDDLRESGDTNMWGAPAYVQRDLAWDRDAARTATKLWMDTFDGQTPLEGRVDKALGA